MAKVHGAAELDTTLSLSTTASLEGNKNLPKDEVDKIYFLALI